MYCFFHPVTTSRDENDVITFPARFTSHAYNNADVNILHQKVYAQPLINPLAPPIGVPLENFEDYLLVKNLSQTDTVVLWWQSYANYSKENTWMRTSILPGQIFAFGDLYFAGEIMNEDPYLYSTTPQDVECEYINVGREPEVEPR